MTWDADEIIPGVYLGSYAAALQLKHLDAHDITLVISLSPYFRPIHADDIDYWIIEAEDRPWMEIYSHFQHITEAMYERIHAEGDGGKKDKENKDEKEDNISHNDEKHTETGTSTETSTSTEASSTPPSPSPFTPSSSVLVHCMQGRSRSASVVAAYLMRYHGHTPTSAVTWMQQRRSIVQPNVGFMQQLETYYTLLQQQQHDVDSKAATSSVPLTRVMSRFFKAKRRITNATSTSSSTSSTSSTSTSTSTSSSPLYDTSGSPGTWTFRRSAQHHIYYHYYRWLYGTKIGNVMHSMVDRARRSGRQARNAQWEQSTATSSSASDWMHLDGEAMHVAMWKSIESSPHHEEEKAMMEHTEREFKQQWEQAHTKQHASSPSSAPNDPMDHFYQSQLWNAQRDALINFRHTKNAQMETQGQ